MRTYHEEKEEAARHVQDAEGDRRRGHGGRGRRHRLDRAGGSGLGGHDPGGHGGPPGVRRRAFRPGSGHLVVTWNKELIKILGVPGEQPATVHPTRSFALLQAAEYDAVNSITHHDRPYLFTVRAPRDARPDAAADQAAHDVLAALYPSMRGELGAVLHTELAKIPGGRGQARRHPRWAPPWHGTCSSSGRTTDPRPRRRRFVSGNLPGDYRPTPPDFPAPVFTGWGKVTPFVLRDGRQFRPAPPPPVTSAAYAAALNQVKSLGRDSSTTRTAGQTAAATFWASAPIWNTWNQVAQDQVPGGQPGADHRPVRQPRLHAGRRHHRHVQRQVPLRGLAAGHRDPAG